MKGGYYIEWTNKEGKPQKGRAMHIDQTSEIDKQDKLLVREVDDQFQDTGKKVVKKVKDVKLIGYID